MIQNWKKMGCVYNNKFYHAVPLPLHLEKDIYRIYFSNRDKQNRSLPYYIDYDLINNKIIHENTIKIELGNDGTFDSDGIMPTSYIWKNNSLYMYYIGWNMACKVPFRNSIGLLISKDRGTKFKKYSNGPILDRSIYDPCFVASNCIFSEDGFYRMYYQSCDKWVKNKNNDYQHFYNIKYAESTDGIFWVRNGHIAIDYKSEKEYAISVPRVIKEDNIYKMWYSYRGSSFSNTYRIGYAESENGINWNRNDNAVGLDVSQRGWDSEMVCYPYVFDHKGKRYMLYNGNSYGKSGFGLAVLEEK